MQLSVLLACRSCTIFHHVARSPVPNIWLVAFLYVPRLSRATIWVPSARSQAFMQCSCRDLLKPPCSTPVLACYSTHGEWPFGRVLARANSFPIPPWVFCLSACLSICLSILHYIPSPLSYLKAAHTKRRVHAEGIRRLELHTLSLPAILAFT